MKFFKAVKPFKPMFDSDCRLCGAKIEGCEYYLIGVSDNEIGLYGQHWICGKCYFVNAI